MLTKLTKGLQITIPAKFRNVLEIDANSVLDIELDTKGNKLIIAPVKEHSLHELFEECDAIRNKSRKSIDELEKDYERDNMLH
jgi:bifunctional DNA-binding transcriptional regulator/antitoxin component of YhaV-PrlF toxin-antitoxin module